MLQKDALTLYDRSNVWTVEQSEILSRFEKVKWASVSDDKIDAVKGWLKALKFSVRVKRYSDFTCLSAVREVIAGRPAVIEGTFDGQINHVPVLS
jgi:hypothetical protein